MRARAECLPLLLRAAVVLIAAAALCRVMASVTGSGDYLLGRPVNGDNAAPAIDALVHGHLGTLASHQPLMGLVTLVWRAPFAGTAMWLGAGHQLVYQAGVVACLMATLAAAWWLAGRAHSPAQYAAVAMAAALIAGGPITGAAAQIGHPEEILTVLLAAASVICAGQDRRRSAAILVGLAIGAKPWALLAAPCVLLALPGGRVRVAALAAVVAAPAVALLPFLNPGAYGRASHYIGALDSVTPWDLWWPMASPGASSHHLPFSLTRTGATAIVFALAAAGIWAYARRLRSSQSGGRIDGLALFCALGLLRCLADPAPVAYYYAAVVIPLALWEAGFRRRFPFLALLVSLAVGGFPQDLALAARAQGWLGVIVVIALWLLAAAALFIYLVRNAVRPRIEADLAGQEEGRASGWRGNPSSGMGSQAAA